MICMCVCVCIYRYIHISLSVYVCIYVCIFIPACLIFLIFAHRSLCTYAQTTSTAGCVLYWLYVICLVIIGCAMGTMGFYPVENRCGRTYKEFDHHGTGSKSIQVELGRLVVQELPWKEKHWQTMAWTAAWLRTDHTVYPSCHTQRWNVSSCFLFLCMARKLWTGLWVPSFVWECLCMNLSCGGFASWGDETPADYEQRLQERMLPVLAGWMQGSSNDCRRVACPLAFQLGRLLKSR